MSGVCDFIVVGAGVVGLSAALALRQRGYSVLILESGRVDIVSNTSSQRVYALNLASQALLQKLGVWDQVDPCAAPYERMVVWDAQSTARIDFDARMLARDRLGVIFEETVLKQALWQAVKKLDIPVIGQWHTQKVLISDNKIILHAETEHKQANFVLIADGARSATRQLLSIPMTSWSYQQHALVTTVAVEKTHQRTAYQIFCPQGPLAFLPMQDAHQCAIVWSSAIAHIERLMTISEEAFAQDLVQAFEHKLGAVQILSERQSYPLRMQHVQQYADKHWALIGDSAHTIHPLAGLGLNLGLEDVATFLKLLDGSKSTILSTKTIHTYQRQRKHAMWQAIIFLQAIHHLFTQNTVPAKLIRRLGLHLCDHVPTMKRFFIEQASGVSR